jgi:hypothetical protein
MDRTLTGLLGIHLSYSSFQLLSVLVGAIIRTVLTSRLSLLARSMSVMCGDVSRVSVKAMMVNV